MSGAERAKLREQIGTNLEEALSLLERYDARDLLSKIAFENPFDNADNFEEGLFSNQISRVEYAQSLALAREFGPTSNAASSEIAEQFTGSTGRVFAQVGRYYSEERAEAAREDLAADIRSASYKLTPDRIRFLSEEEVESRRREAEDERTSGFPGHVRGAGSEGGGAPGRDPGGELEVRGGRVA